MHVFAAAATALPFKYRRKPEAARFQKGVYLGQLRQHRRVKIRTPGTLVRDQPNRRAGNALSAHEFPLTHKQTRSSREPHGRSARASSPSGIKIGRAHV